MCVSARGQGVWGAGGLADRLGGALLRPYPQPDCVSAITVKVWCFEHGDAGALRGIACAPLGYPNPQTMNPKRCTPNLADIGPLLAAGASLQAQQIHRRLHMMMNQNVRTERAQLGVLGGRTSLDEVSRCEGVHQGDRHPDVVSRKKKVRARMSMREGGSDSERPWGNDDAGARCGCA